MWKQWMAGWSDSHFFLLIHIWETAMITIEGKSYQKFQLAFADFSVTLVSTDHNYFKAFIPESVFFFTGWCVVVLNEFFLVRLNNPVDEMMPFACLKVSLKFFKKRRAATRGWKIRGMPLNVQPTSHFLQQSLHHRNQERIMVVIAAWKQHTH